MSTDHTAPATITLTLTSLTTTSYRQSAAVTTPSSEDDALVGGSVQVGTSPTVDKLIRIFLYGTVDAGTTYTAGASGSDAAYTVGVNEVTLLKELDPIEVDATSDHDYEWGPFSVAQAFGGSIPEKWGVIVKNETGATLNATGTNNFTKYTGITYS